jgi:hypothetical protein
MAERIEIKSVLTPAGTTVAAPLTTALNWRQGYPIRVEFRFPPGPSGLVGIQLLHSGEVVVPHDRTEWLITDDEPVIWPLDGFPYNAKYAVRSYNLDVYEHTVQVRMLFNEVAAQQIVPMTPIPITVPLVAALEG